jgi:predicted enzyme related to lactoylglutathione lyase
MQPFASYTFATFTTLNLWTEAERLGATVLRPKTALQKKAWHAVVADPEGNIFAIYQSEPEGYPPSRSD